MLNLAKLTTAPHPLLDFTEDPPQAAFYNLIIYHLRTLLDPLLSHRLHNKIWFLLVYSSLDKKLGCFIMGHFIFYVTNWGRLLEYI